ncbi:MAG: HEAT repeat domain-containing protein [Chloroflexaceae bacterium]
MLRFIEKLLNIRTSEWSRLLLLYTILFIFTFGWTWGATITEASFLDKLGFEALPWFFMLNGVLSIPIIIIYTAFADRTANDRLLIGIVVVSIFSIALCLLLISLGQQHIAYLLLYIILFILDEVFAMHWYIYVNGYFDTRSAKRIIPVLSTAVIVAAIVAGMTVNLVSSIFSPVMIVGLWLLMLVSVTVIVRVASAWLKPSLTEATPVADTPPPDHETIAIKFKLYLQNIREGYRFVQQSVLLRWMALSSLMVMILLAFLEYKTSQVLLTELQTTERIASFIGYVVAAGNCIILPFQLFLLSRITGRIGVGNANLIFPVTNFAIVAGLIALPGLPTAALAYFDRDRLYGSTGFLTDNLLYNAVPLRVKGRALAFIGGFVFHFGAFVGGLLLLSLQILRVAWLLPALLGSIALLYLLNTLVIRKKYSQALIAMLEEEDYAALLSHETASLRIADPATLKGLKQKLDESPNDEVTIFMAKLISQVGGNDAAPILAQTIRSTKSAHVRSALLDILNAANTTGEVVRQLYRDCLNDPVPQVRQSALAGLEDLYDLNNAHYLALAAAMLADPDLNVCTQALLPLLSTRDTTYQTAATEALQALLASPEPHARARGVYVLGQVEHTRFLPCLINILSDPADEVRLEAARALERRPATLITETDTADLLEKLRHLVQDPIERVRQAAVTLLGRIETDAARTLLLPALTDSSSQIRATAVDTLVHQGATVVPLLTPHLEAADEQLRKMVAVVLTRIQPAHFRSITLTFIDENLHTIYRTLGMLEVFTPYADQTSIAVLQSALRERNATLIDELFYLLTALNDQSTVRVIADALHSEVSHVRANAAEALESLTSSRIARLIEPLFDPEASPATRLSLGQKMWELPVPDTRMAVEQLAASPDPWLRTMLVFALGDIAVTVEIPGGRPAVSPAAEPARAVRRKRAADRLSTLFDSLDPAEPADMQPAEPSPNPAHDASVTPPAQVPALTQSDGALLTASQRDDLIERALHDAVADVRLAARAARRKIAGQTITATIQEEERVLSTIERITFLKGIPFFQGMSLEQLKVLAAVCEEQFFAQDTRIFNQGDAGGTLYVIVSGRVAIEQERRAGSFARLATIEAHSYFGEASLFDGDVHAAAAIATQDTLTLRLRREPLIALARQYPDLSLELINVLSRRLREANSRIAELTRTMPRQLHKLFDQFE